MDRLVFSRFQEVWACRAGPGRWPGPTIAASFLLLLSIWLLLIPGTAAAQEVTYTVRDTADPCLVVRAEPNTDAEQIDCLAPGTTVTHLDVVPYWRKIRLADGREGWAAKQFLELASAPPPAPPPTSIPSDAFLEVHFIDVGQGDAIWIHTHDDGIDGNGIFEGKNIVIDGGPYSADTTNRCLPYLESRGHHGAVLDALIVSHPHSDHFRGAETLARHFTIRDYYDPGCPTTLTSYAAFLRALRGEGGQPAQAERVRLGKEEFGNLDWGSELTAEVLYAWPGDPAGLGSGNTRINNSSIVLRLEYGQHSFLFMGDAEGKDRSDLADVARYVEKILVDTISPAKLKSTVLKVAHHGSETSSTIPFIQAVEPQIVVAQSGRRSFSGTFLPDASTLRRYCCHNPNTRIYRTDQNDEADGLGTSEAADGDDIVIRTNGATLDVQALEGGEPFAVNACEPIAARSEREAETRGCSSSGET